MSNVSTLFRSLLIYSICVPLAVVLGYFAACPDNFTSLDPATLWVVLPLVFLLATPLFLRWHHSWLIFAWNSTIFFYFLRTPGWMALAWVSLLISVLQYTLNRRLKFLPVGPMTRPLIFLAVVILVTADARGGFGLQLLGGSSVGGKNYIVLLSAIAGFFALTARAIPPQRVLFFVGLFFAGQATMALSELSAFAPSWLAFLFVIFPASTPLSARPFVNDPLGGGLSRLGALAGACTSVIWLMFARYGIENIFTWRHLGRLVLFVSLLFLSLLGGFRSMLAFFLLAFGILFYLEGQMRKPLLPAMLLTLFLGGSVLLPFVGHLPLSVQRALSFLPIRVDPVAQASADMSTEWRIKIWKNVIPQIPQYLLLGKGYAISAADFALTQNEALTTTEFGTEVAGDYHNGPLSVIMPFGIPGVLAFVWVLIAGLKVLRQNLQYGDPAFAQINRLLFSLFAAKIVFFFLIFGGFAIDLAYFVGLVGLSICINQGIAERVLAAPQPKVVYERFKIPRPIRKPLSA
jgi:hypothetical protein